MTLTATAPFRAPVLDPPDITIGIRWDELQAIAAKRSVVLDDNDAKHVHRGYTDEWQKAMIAASERFWINAIQGYLHHKLLGRQFADVEG